MATILFTYEFGAGLGHLNRLIAVAKRLSAEHAIAFALPDVVLGGPVVRRALGDAARAFAGVHWPAPKDPAARRVPTHTFADVIRLFGFADPQRLVAGARHWLDLIERIAPDLVVADFAPTLALALADRIPAIVVGNGYTVPPAGRVLPPMRSWEGETPPLSRAHEGRLIEAVNRARIQLSGPSVDHFSDLLQGRATFICTLAEFDPYGAYREGPILWPFNIPEMPRGGPFAERNGPAVFAYLPANHPSLRNILAALSALDRACEIYVTGADPKGIARLCGPKVRIHAQPADFAKILPEASLLIHHAGLGTAYAGLGAGLPQLILPQSLEHLITARGLQSFGVAATLAMSPPASVELTCTSIANLIADGVRQEAALRAADALARRRQIDPVGVVVEACRRHLGHASAETALQPPRRASV